MAAKTKTFAMVSERALVARIKRKLAKDDRGLKRGRTVKVGNRLVPDSNTGWYYTVDYGRNRIIKTHLDLESFARKIGVLDGWEKLAKE